MFLKLVHSVWLMWWSVIKQTRTLCVPMTSGVSVGVVRAVDGDEGINAQLSYSILSLWGRDKFSIHHSTGILTVIASLDYEEVRHRTLRSRSNRNGLIIHIASSAHKLSAAVLFSEAYVV